MMKYLKVFEGFGDDYYQVVDDDEYWDNLDKRVEISSNNISLITKLFSNGLYLDSNIIYVKKIRKVSGLKRYDYSIKLYEVDDEYFYVNVMKQDSKYSSLHKPSKNILLVYSYKCDQIDGLVEFLKNEGFI